jgi:hypothetical protein
MLHPLYRTRDSDSRARKRDVRGRLMLPAVVAVTVLAGSAPAMATVTPTAAGPAPNVQTEATAQGIIMRDGGICDPIRHMGC